MNKLLPLFFILNSLIAFGQQDLEKLTKPIVDEGKRLYRCEMASWYGTDLFLENYKNRENVGGYFSYTENEISKCVFFSNADSPKVIGTISFDSTYNTKTAKTDLTEREFTNNELNLYKIRQGALALIRSDTLFKTYKNTNLNLIPLISEGERKAYVLTGPQQNGVVIFGNDYLLIFDDNYKATLKKQLHRNIIPIYYDSEKEGQDTEGTLHSHLPETGDFITPTDICTLMLYAKYAKWKQHNVISQKYLNIWNCLTDELVVIPMETIEKIDKDQEKKKKKKKE